MKKIEVSILCITYNHENYIRDALNGFIMQKTNFNYEVLVHDDASTDKTADIIREYEKKYPDIIKPIYQKKNQYSQGISITSTFLWPKVRGKYIAFCEGDDYWIDSNKLQLQYDILEQHSEIDMCSHSSLILSADGKERKHIVSNEDIVLSPEQIIAGGGGYISTNSLMYRKELDDKIPRFREILKLDYTTQIHGALRGGIFYLHEIMSVYREGVPNSWTDRMRKDPQSKISHCIKVLNMLECLNEETNYKYQSAIGQVRYCYKIELSKLEKNFTWVKSEELYRKFKLRTKFLVWLECIYPKVYKKIIIIYQKIIDNINGLKIFIL